MIECDHCGDTFHNYTTHNTHECGRDVEPIPDAFAVDEYREKERRHREGNRWLKRHGYL